MTSQTVRRVVCTECNGRGMTMPHWTELDPRSPWNDPEPRVCWKCNGRGYYNR